MLSVSSYHPPSPPVSHREPDCAYYPSECTASNNSRRVSFCRTVEVMPTFSPSDYDRTSIEVDPLTEDDIEEVLEMRRRMRREHDAMYRRHLFAQTAEEHIARAAQRSGTTYTCTNAAVSPAGRDSSACSSQRPIGTYLRNMDAILTPNRSTSQPCF
ncbi:hypothetical protein BC832DRAFT_538807 [Gaertneriomyces semiglobifer]|nr:hypothetical protein BC832DRAFT_538807 [Gaertneriomyces semiglobifer]